MSKTKLKASKYDMISRKSNATNFNVSSKAPASVEPSSPSIMNFKGNVAQIGRKKKKKTLTKNMRLQPFPTSYELGVLTPIKQLSKMSSKFAKKKLAEQLGDELCGGKSVIEQIQVQNSLDTFPRYAQIVANTEQDDTSVIQSDNIMPFVRQPEILVTEVLTVEAATPMIDRNKKLHPVSALAHNNMLGFHHCNAPQITALSANTDGNLNESSSLAQGLDQLKVRLQTSGSAYEDNQYGLMKCGTHLVTQTLT